MPAPVVAEIATASTGSSGSSGCDGGRSILFHTTTRGRDRGDAEQLAVVVGERPRSIEHHDRQIGDANRGLRARDAFLLHDIRRVANAGRIDQRQRQPADVGPLGQQVARRARDRRDDGAVGVQQRVEQARLADVRRADDRHGAPSRTSRPRSACASSASMRAITPAIASPRFLRRHEVIALVREIERRLEPRDDVEQIAFDRRDRRRQRALRVDRTRPAPAAA